MKLVACALLLATASFAAEPAAPRRVALVFDDGPIPADADALLAVLAREKIAVTFSLVGKNVQAHPETARAIAQAGHEIANHSQTHVAIKDLDDAALQAEVSLAQAGIKEAVGTAPRWYWPPFLAADDRLRAAVRKAGLEIYPTPALVVSRDYDRSVPAAQIYELATTGVKDGTVILFHEWRAETREQLPRILTELRRQGCTFHTFSGLLEKLGRPVTQKATP